MLAYCLWHVLVGVALLRIALPIGKYAVVRARGEGGVILMFAVFLGAGGAAMISDSFGKLPTFVVVGIVGCTVVSALPWRQAGRKRPAQRPPTKPPRRSADSRASVTAPHRKV